ncbi:MAG: matrixin family metalloprotease [Patescibacteria group bacterium]
MRKIITYLLVGITILAFAGVVDANMQIPASEVAKQKAKAPEKSPVINENWEIDRVDFVHYARPEKSGKPNKPPKDAKCYKLLGVKWSNLPVNYVINPTNNDGLSSSTVMANISAAAETWDSFTSSELFNDNYQIDDSVIYGKRDNKNALSFGDYLDNQVIAVTSIWYNRRTKQIIEYDILFNNYYQWGDATDPGTPDVMDLRNIATHELGHAIGLNDIYDSACSQVTMYGYSIAGEVEKRTLAQPDINGLQLIYGL